MSLIRALSKLAQATVSEFELPQKFSSEDR